MKEEKIHSLACADIVLLTEEEERMRCIMRRLKGYLREKGLELSVSKSKVLRFKKRGGGKNLEW